MATDVRTPNLGLLKQGTGNNNNIWGDLLNSQVIDILDAAIAGVAAIVVDGSDDYTISDSDVLNSAIYISGALTADQTLIVPNKGKKWTFFNATTGDFFVLLKVAGGTSAVNIPTGTSTDIWCNGSGSLFRGDSKQIGNIFFHGGTTPPPGALACDNTTFKRASLPDLYGRIGTTFGSTDSTNFKVPPGTDTGRYLRSSSSGVDVGTLQSNQNKSHSHTGAGTTSQISADHVHTGSGTTGGMNANNPHSHTYSLPAGSNSYQPANNFALNQFSGSTSTTTTNIDHGHFYSFTTSGVSSNHTHTYSFTTSSDGGTEARPESLVALMCIWY